MLSATMLFAICNDHAPDAQSNYSQPSPTPTPAAALASPSPTAPQTGSTPPSSTQDVPVYTYEVVNTWPHDPAAFTQGLVFYQDYLYESTGKHGLSSLRRVELKNGKVAKKVRLAEEYFAEGMTILQDKIYQLTWTSQKGFIYDPKDLRRKGEFAYLGEGWGLTDDEHLLIMSDGSNQLRFIDPATFKTERTINVTGGDGQPLNDLNELEYVKGEIYANVWKQERIARLDPQTGKLLGWIDLRGLTPPEAVGDPENVLNGIAYDDATDRLFVTGKRWPKLFEIRLQRK